MPTHFYREQHGLVFGAMIELYELNRKIDHLTIAEVLRQNGKLDQVGGEEAIEQLAGWVPAAGHAREYGEIVHDNAKLRDLLTASYEIQASVLAREAPARDLVEAAERAVLEVATDERQKKIRSIHEHPRRRDRQAAPALDLEDVADRDAVGVQGHRREDRRVSARQPGRARGAAVDGQVGAGRQHRRERRARRAVPVALFSLEMSESELAQRFIASQANKHGEDLRRGKVAAKEWPRVLNACQKLSDAPLFIDDSSDTGVLEIRAKCRRLHAQIDGGLGLVIVDYLQLMRSEGTDREPGRAGRADEPRAEGAGA